MKKKKKITTFVWEKKGDRRRQRELLYGTTVEVFGSDGDSLPVFFFFFYVKVGTHINLITQRKKFRGTL